MEDGQEGSFKLLKLPISEDAILNRIISIGPALTSEEEPLYMGMIFTMILDHITDIPSDGGIDDVHISNAYKSLEEAAMWMGKYYGELWID